MLLSGRPWTAFKKPIGTLCAFVALGFGVAHAEGRNDDLVFAGHYLVKIRRETEGLVTNHRHHLKTVRKFGKTRHLIRRRRATASADGLADASRRVETADECPEIERDPNVQFCELVQVVQAQAVPNDPYYPYQWALKNQINPGIDVGAEDAWDVTTGSSAVTVAVVDTGIDYGHPDLQSNLWVNVNEAAGDGIDNDGNGIVDDVYGANFQTADAANGNPMDDHGHGTFCAGVIGAAGNDGQGITGINQHVRLMAVKFLRSDGSGSTAGAVNAIRYAVDQGARVINNSWGSASYSAALQDVIDYAYANGVTVVAAAGNSGTNNDERPFFPSSMRHVISVGAIDNAGSLAGFSNRGMSVHLAAPGVSILGTYLHAVYANVFMSGTSMSAPQVSGVVGLMLAANPSLSPDQIAQILVANVAPLASLTGRVASGGMLRADASVRAARDLALGIAPTPPVVTPPTATPGVTPTPKPKKVVKKKRSKRGLRRRQAARERREAARRAARSKHATKRK
ncbi:MAG: S8 family serine peptidase [Gemmataceae bacterium]|nr:S8 family serine peptidase [Gemmataceae bacterium]